MNTEPLSFDRQKQQRLYDNFIDDIFALKKYLDDPAVTDIFTTGTGEIIVKRFAEGKVFTGETFPPWVPVPEVTEDPCTGPYEASPHHLPQGTYRFQRIIR
jgi:hypothetical protein